MQRSYFTRIISVLVVACFLPCQAVSSQPRPEEVCSEALAPPSEFTSGVSADGKSVLKRILGNIAGMAKDTILRFWKIKGLMGYPSLSALVASTFWIPFLEIVRTVLPEGMPLRAGPIIEQERGISYEQFVSRDKSAPRFQLRVDALGISHLLESLEELQRDGLDTYQLVLQDTQTGAHASLNLGKSLHSAMGAMNHAAMLLARGSTLDETAHTMRKYAARAPAGLPSRQYEELRRGIIPDPSLYQGLPSGPSRTDREIREKARILFVRLFSPPAITASPQTVFTDWTGKTIFPGTVRNTREYRGMIVRDMVRPGDTHSEYRLMQDPRVGSGNWILESPSSGVIFDSGADAARWRQILEAYLRELYEETTAQEISRDISEGRRRTAMQRLAWVDPVWMRNLSALPEDQRAEKLDIYLRNLPALREKIEELMGQLQEPQHDPRLAHYLQAVYLAGDDLHRTGLAALHAFLLEHGCIQGEGLLQSRMGQIVWGLMYLLKQNPEDFPYQKLMQMTKPLQEPRKPVQETLDAMIKQEATQMTKDELYAFFANLSHPNAKKRRDNLDENTLHKLKAKAGQDAPKPLFDAVVALMEECVESKNRLPPLLESLRVVRESYREWPVESLIEYLDSPEKNPVVKNLLVDFFAETKDPFIFVASQFVKMHGSPRYFHPIPREWLILGVLRKGNAKSVQLLFENILAQRSAEDLRHFTRAWALTPAGISSFECLQNIFDAVPGFLADKNRRLTDPMLLQLGGLFTEIANASAGSVFPSGQVDPGMDRPFGMLRREARDKAAGIFKDLWNGRHSRETRLAAADGMIRLARLAGDAQGAAEWTEKKKECAEEKEPHALENLFRPAPAGREILERDIIYRPSQFRGDLQNSEIRYFHRLDSLIPREMNLSAALLRMRLRGEAFENFLILYQKGSGPGEEIGKLYFAFVQHPSMEGLFFELPDDTPDREFKDILLEKARAFPKKMILPVPPKDLKQSVEILLPLYMLHTLDPAFSSGAKREIGTNIFSRHLLERGLTADLSIARGIAAFWPQDDVAGAYFPTTGSVMNRIGRKAGVDKFVHEALHHGYVKTMNFSDRKRNRSYFSGEFQGGPHPLLAKIREHRYYAQDIRDRPDTLYNEALAFTAQALAAWRTVSYFGTPILYSDVQHLDALGLLPQAMRLEPLGFGPTAEPIGPAYFEKVLEGLQNAAARSGSPEDRRTAQLHLRLLTTGVYFAGTPDPSQLDKLSAAGLWDGALRDRAQDRLQAIRGLGLKDGDGNTRRLPEFLTDTLEQAETWEGTPLIPSSVLLRGDFFSRKDPEQLEIVVAVEGTKPEKPLEFNSTAEGLIAEEAADMPALRRVRVTVLGAESAAFAREEAPSLWNNSLLWAGTLPRSPSPEQIKASLPSRLAGIEKRIARNELTGAAWDILDVYLKLEETAPGPQRRGEIMQAWTVISELEESVLPDEKPGLQSLLRFWTIKAGEALANVPFRAPSSGALLGRTSSQTDGQRIGRAKKNAAAIGEKEQKELLHAFLGELDGDQKRRLKEQQARIVFSRDFGALMAREGNRIYVDKSLIPRPITLPQGMDILTYKTLRRQIYKALLIHELAHKDFSWEEEIYAIRKELEVLGRLSPAELLGITESVLPHLGIQADETLLDEYIELAGKARMEYPEASSGMLKEIVSFAQRHYPAVRKARLLDARGDFAAGRRQELAALLEIRALQEEDSGEGGMTSSLSEEQQQILAKELWSGALDAKGFSAILRAIQGVGYTTFAEIPTVYRFALPPADFDLFQQRVQKNQALLNFMQRPEAIGAAKRDFLRTARLATGNPLRGAYEFVELLSREDGKNLLPLLDMPFDDPRASLLDAGGSIGTLLAPGIEGAAKKSGGKTASVTVTDMNANLLRAGPFLRDPVLRFTYVEDDLTTSNLKSGSMDAAVVKNFFSHLMAKESLSPGNKFRMALASFAHLNRILKSGKKLCVVDFRENENLIRYCASLFGFDSLGVQHAAGVLFTQDYSVLSFSKARNVSALEGYAEAKETEARINHLAFLVLSRVSPDHRFVFSIDGAEQSAIPSEAFPALLDALVQEKSVSLQLPGGGIAISLPSPMAASGKEGSSFSTLYWNEKSGKLGIDTSGPASKTEIQNMERICAMPSLNALLKRGMRIAVDKRLGTPMHFSAGAGLFSLDYDFMMSRPAEEIIALCVLRVWEEGWLPERLGRGALEPLPAGAEIKVVSAEQFSASSEFQELLLRLEASLGSFRDKPGETPEALRKRYVEERDHFAKAGAKMAVLFDGETPVGFAAGAPLQAYEKLSGIPALDQYWLAGNAFYVSHGGMLPKYRKRSLKEAIKNQILRSARENGFRYLIEHTEASGEPEALDLYPDLPYSLLRLGNLMMPGAKMEPGDAALLRNWNAVLDSHPRWVEVSPRLREFQNTTRFLLKTTVRSGPVQLPGASSLADASL